MTTNTSTQGKAHDFHRNSASKSLLLTAALFGSVVAGAAPASADDQLAPPPLAVPSSPAAVVQTVDGWTLTLSATEETRFTVPTPGPEVPPSEVVVGGLFTAALRDSDGGTYPTPGGTIEVGYETQCAPAGMMAALMTKPGVTTTQVLREEFSGANPSATVDAFHLQISCMGTALVRSYAILTRTTSVTNSVAAYYGPFLPL